MGGGGEDTTLAVYQSYKENIFSFFHNFVSIDPNIILTMPVMLRIYKRLQPHNEDKIYI